MDTALFSLVGDVLGTSPFLQSVRASKELFQNRNLRGLSPQEIAALKENRNRCNDWSTIRVSVDFIPDFISDCTFAGPCTLGVFTGKPVTVYKGTELPSGLYRSTIINATIDDDCLIDRVALLYNYCVNRGAVVFDCAILTSSGDCTFGNSIEIALGIETGGREVRSYAEMTIPVATAVAMRRGDKGFLDEYSLFVKSYTAACTSTYGILESGSCIRCTGTIENAYIGNSVIIDGATTIKNCTILGGTDEKTLVGSGAFLKDSCVQWGCEVTSMALVDSSVLTEHSHVERHGKVTQSIIGPNTGIAEGEVTASLVGPFVGFHHQAMLIAALWPEGKGNVAYGANLGSNHTSKAPDQEIWCGEGVFFGLGSSVKFPVNLTGAPYSIVATGVMMLPQKIEFPFSLINEPSKQYDSISPAYNEIIPGWVLGENYYAVRRNEGKFEKRNKAKRTLFEFTVLRPEIVDMMMNARDTLDSVKTEKEFYTEAEISGLGKNFLTEHNRIAAIKVYGFYLQYYALSGLWNRIASFLVNDDSDRIKNIYEMRTGEPLWDHQRTILIREDLVKVSPAENIRRLIASATKVAEDIERSKARDDIRGRKIIPDYDQAHTLAEDDSFVRQTKESTAQLIGDLEKALVKLEKL